MRERRNGSATKLQRARWLATVALAIVAATNAAHAQTGTGVVTASVAPQDRIVVHPGGQRLIRPVPHGIDLALRPTWTSTRSTSASEPSFRSAFQASSSNRPRSTRRKVIGGVIGAVGGFFGGAFLGAAIEGDRCECDDPGFVGFWIGAPVGSVLGGIAGAKWL
jgi:hypothetical protein